MGVITKLGLYVLGLAVVFAAMFGVGALVGPVLPDNAPEHSAEQSHEGATPGEGADHDTGH